MTNGEIDRLGKRISESTGDILEEDLESLQAYRLSFQESIARVFGFVLYAASRIDRQCVVTYRIKRIDTIIEKLRRFKINSHGRMAFSNMSDIAGCRCIMNTPSNDKLYQLLTVIKNQYGEDCKINDYVQAPKESGYRSIHVYVKEPATQKKVEIQIRSKAHHNWATLVEIVDLLYNDTQKEQEGAGPLGRFLFLYSKAADLSSEEFSEMLKIERKLKVFEHMSETLSMNYLKIRIQWLTQQKNGSYFVITANKKGSDIESFQTFKAAEDAYYEKYLNNTDSNIVLTHLDNPDFSQISMAYSNYMLAMHSFFDDYRVYVAKKITESVQTKSYFEFFKDFNIYNKNLLHYFKILSREVKNVKQLTRSNNSSISRNQLNKWWKEIRERLLFWQNETQLFLNNLYSAANGNTFERWMIHNRINRMINAIKAGQKE